MTWARRNRDQLARRVEHEGIKQTRQECVRSEINREEQRARRSVLMTVAASTDPGATTGPTQSAMPVRKAGGRVAAEISAVASSRQLNRERTAAAVRGEALSGRRLRRARTRSGSGTNSADAAGLVVLCPSQPPHHRAPTFWRLEMRVRGFPPQGGQGMTRPDRPIVDADAPRSPCGATDWSERRNYSTPSRPVLEFLAAICGRTRRAPSSGVRNAYADGSRRIMVHAPTSAGKTMVAGTIARGVYDIGRPIPFIVPVTPIVTARRPETETETDTGKGRIPSQRRMNTTDKTPARVPPAKGRAA